MVGALEVKNLFFRENEADVGTKNGEPVNSILRCICSLHRARLPFANVNIHRCP